MQKTAFEGIKVSIFLVLLCGSASTAHAAADDLRIWGGSGDEIVTGGRDADGNFYLVGQTTSFSPAGSKVLLLKYDVDRNHQWSRVWDWDDGDLEVNVGTVTADGDLFVSGNTASDLLVARFDSAGGFVWARTWDSDSSLGDAVDSVAVGPAGNLYAVGGTSSPRKVLVVKFSGNGDFVWARTWERDPQDSAEDSCNGVAVDPSGNVLCGGNSQDGSFRTEALVLKLTPSGALDWARTWRSQETGASSDDAFSVVVDAGGNPTLVGASDTVGEADNTMVVRFLSNGDRDWARIWGKTLDGGAGSNDGSGSSGVGVDGSIYTGTALVTSDDPYLGQALLLKFDSDGNRLHAKSWGGDPAKACFFSSYDASDPFELFVAGGTDDSSGALRNVYRETAVPADLVTPLTGTLGSQADGSSSTTFTEIAAAGCVSPPCGAMDALVLRLTRVCVDVGTGPFPTTLSLGKGDCGPPVAVPGRTVEVVRGELDQVGLTGSSVDLGFVECVGHAVETDRVEDLSDTPESGSKGYYFLARNPALESDFGSATSGESRDTWSSDSFCP